MSNILKVSFLFAFVCLSTFAYGERVRDDFHSKRAGTWGPYQDPHDTGRNYSHRNERYNDRNIQGRNYPRYRNYQNYNNYNYPSDYWNVPVYDANSYNDITNPYDGQNSSNFQNSTFDSQVWDFNN